MGSPFVPPLKPTQKTSKQSVFSAPFKHMAPIFTSHIFLQEAGGENMEDFLVGCWLVVCWIQLNKKTTNQPTNAAKMHSSPIWLVVGWIQFFKNKTCQPFM